MPSAVHVDTVPVAALSRALIQSPRVEGDTSCFSPGLVGSIGAFCLAEEICSRPCLVGVGEAFSTPVGCVTHLHMLFFSLPTIQKLTTRWTRVTPAIHVETHPFCDLRHLPGSFH